MARGGALAGGRRGTLGGGGVRARSGVNQLPPVRADPATPRGASFRLALRRALSRRAPPEVAERPSSPERPAPSRRDDARGPAGTWPAATTSTASLQTEGAERCPGWRAAAPEEPATGRLLPAAAVEHVAVEAGRLRQGQLLLGFGDLKVFLGCSPAGLELWLEAGPALRSAARAELPGLVAAIRARGVAVARAGVRARAGERDGGGWTRRAR